MNPEFVSGAHQNIINIDLGVPLSGRAIRYIFCSKKQKDAASIPNAPDQETYCKISRAAKLLKIIKQKLYQD